MHPGEERRSRSLVEPRQCAIHDLPARPLGGVDTSGQLIPGEIEVVYVGVEALCDAPSAIEHERADEAAGPVSVRLQHFGERRLIVADVELTVVSDAVKCRKGARQERRMRREGQRRDRRGVGESKSARGEGVEGGRLGRLVAVTAQPIGAERID
jgi:hypothetical protein